MTIVPLINSPPTNLGTPRHIRDVEAMAEDLGASHLHVAQFMRQWVHARPQCEGRRKPEGFFPSRLVAGLPEIQKRIDEIAAVSAEHPGEDGSARLLVTLADGGTVESVLLPPKGSTKGLCVSTQLGCAVGCQFCMTGQSGLLRQLGSAEIVAQVVLARRLREVNKVVFMGMGEPSHNLDNVLDAIQFLGTTGGIGHKNLVFSTVGDHRVFKRLPEGAVKPALALSLHTTDSALRARLLPRAPVFEPAELIALADDYARKTGYPLQVQWTLLEGINDTREEAVRIAELLKGRYAMLNLIPFNSVEGTGFKRPTAEHAAAMVQEIQSRGVLTRLRQSAGQDVEGGCGQLRARHLAERSDRLPLQVL
jgi:23S rRNA (adenine2503-C2)-methyltransferase